MDMKKKLEEIAEDQLESFAQFRKKCHLNAEEIFKVLGSKSQYEIIRSRVITCKGRKSISNNVYKSDLSVVPVPDFELAIFVNFNGPPFEQVLDDFEKVLRAHSCKRHKFHFEGKFPQSIQFHMKDISSTHPKDFISFELFPAKNCILPGEEKLLLLSDESIRVRAREMMQAERSLTLMTELVNPRNDPILYSSSLSESYASFVEGQSEFVQSVIRLGKLWDRKVRWGGDGKLHGRLRLIELVAISAAVSEEIEAKKTRRDEEIFLAFQFFCKKFLNFDRYMCELLKFPEGLNLPLPYRTYIENTCAMGGPIILDPVNPFHNLATHVTDDMKEAFRSQAKVTLRSFRTYSKHRSGKYFQLESYFGI